MTTTAPASTSRLIDLNPDLLSAYQAFASAALEGGSLEPQVRAAAALAAAITANRTDAVRVYLAAAKQSGLSNEDVGQVAAIVDVVRLETHQRAPAGGTTGGHEHNHVHAAAAPKAAKSCC